MQEDESQDKDDLGRKLYEWFTDADDARQEWFDEAIEMYALVAGDAWTNEEKAFLEERFRSAVNFNRTGVVIDSIVGQQIGNRQEIKYLPVTQGDVDVNDLLTSTIKWIDEQSDADTEITEAFRDLTITGMGWLEAYMEYDTDLDGRIQSAAKFSPLDAYWDPSSEKKNLEDSRYRMRGRLWQYKEAVDKWPKLADISVEDLSQLGGKWYKRFSLTGRRADRRKSVTYNEDQSGFRGQDRDEVYIVQCQYYELADIWRVLDPSSGQIIELDKEKFDRIADEQGIQFVKQKKRQYRQAYFLGKFVLEDEIAPYKDGFSLLPMTHKRDEVRGMWYGVARSMRDPQKWSNKFFSDILEIMAQNRKGGAFIEDDAVDDIRAAEQDWNDPSGLIWVRPGALTMGKIRERDPFPYPQGLDRLMQFAISSIPDTSGVNLEIMGLVDKNQAGILEAQRKQAGLSILSSLFDALRQMQKSRGRVLEYFVRNYISDGRLARVIEQDGTEKYIPILRSPDTIRYDVIVDESPDSPNMRDKTFAALMQVVPMMMQAGIPVPPQVMDYLPVPRSLIQQWKEFIQENKQQEQRDPRVEADAQLKNAQAQKVGAEIQKIGAETQKVGAEIGKVNAETEEIKVSAQTKPYQVANDLLS